ncbi:hypothetical protein ACGFX4_09990 [Kitasatospora sp. NPDC048365]|uniref:hypothetical protein n=1 Tax=Kitasatospora sp. NPDC048365 TaxID=3364050 RepID=UPI0037188712
MISPSPGPLTVEAAAALQRHLGTEVRPGLSEQELDTVEARFGFRFAADHRTFLSAGLPSGSPSWPDWRDGDPDDLWERLRAPVDGVLFAVAHNGFWHPLWGPRPEDTGEAQRVARAELAAVPRLVPVFGHRYLPAGAGDHGHPVLSVHQTDIICYGDDLADYLAFEFTGRSRSSARPRSRVRFWSYVVHRDESTFTTPHDPYERSAADAVEHLRMLALERRIGRLVPDEQFVQTGLVALVLDVEAPSLQSLATLSPAEFGTAPALFDRVLGELGITSAIPTDDAEVRWELVRWWLRLIVTGSASPATGAGAVVHDGWAALGRPDVLQPLANLLAAADAADHAARRQASDAVVTEAERLLTGSWPPRSV